MAAFATTTDLEKFWRDLTSAENSRASDLLDYASDYLRMLGENQGVDVDEKSDNSNNFKSMLKYTVMAATQRAMSAPELSGGAESYSMTAGPYSENYRFANPSGDLYFTKRELSILGLKGQRLRSISTTRWDIYGDND